MSKRAIILAGGRGTRLRPYTVVLPKPLMPIGDYPILEVIIRQLVKAKFEHVTLAVNHQADIIKAYFKNGETWGIKIDYSLETEPLGTMGPLRLINDLPKNFLVMNGDVLTNLDFCKFYEEHIKHDRIFTISSKIREQKIDYGVLNFDDQKKLNGFTEKPTTSFNVSMGVYMCSKEAIEYIPSDGAFGFDSLMLKLIEHDKEIKVQPFEGYWLDIGRPDDYAQAIDKFSNMSNQFI